MRPMPDVFPGRPGLKSLPVDGLVSLHCLAIHPSRGMLRNLLEILQHPCWLRPGRNP
jgi:hypothetical protein